MLSSLMRQTCLNTVAPSSQMFNELDACRLALPNNLPSRRSCSISGSRQPPIICFSSSRLPDRQASIRFAPFCVNPMRYSTIGPFLI
jgi:hypothetical protein